MENIWCGEIIREICNQKKRKYFQNSEEGFFSEGIKIIFCNNVDWESINNWRFYLFFCTKLPMIKLVGIK